MTQAELLKLARALPVEEMHQCANEFELVALLIRQEAAKAGRTEVERRKRTEARKTSKWIYRPGRN